MKYNIKHKSIKILDEFVFLITLCQVKIFFTKKININICIFI